MSSINTAIQSPKRRLKNNASPVKPVFDAIGGTPLLDVSEYSPNSRVRIFAKAEWCNPGRSVKDRPAARMMRTALRRGELSREKILLDSTSGNTGVAYALLGAALGMRVRLVVPENVSTYQKNLLRAYGAEVIFSSAQEGSDGAIRLARALRAEEPQRYFYADQYNNCENWRAHYFTTANEIWRQTRGQLTHFIAGLGTSGTFIGTSRRLRELNPAIRIISMQPASPLHGLEGLKHMPSAIVPGIYDARLADLNLEVETEPSQDLVLHLARKKGLLAGLSSGAALAAARKLAAQIESGVVVTIFPDGGQRYLEESFWHAN